MPASRYASACRETWIRRFLAGIAGCSLLALGLILAFLFLEGVPALIRLSPLEFFFGREWYPTAEPPDFGILPFIAGSVAVTVTASALAIPLGVMTAVWLTEIAPAPLRRVVKPLVELLAALPSVVVGFFGMAVVAPLLQRWLDIDTGLNLMNAGLMLAFMSVPTICSISEDALYSVPRSLREASLALGATRWETTIEVVVPAAFSGICTACMLGMARSVGETMVVLMVAGGAGILPASLFDPVRPLPAAIAAEISEASFGGDQYHVLFAMGLLLFVGTLAFTLVARRIAEKNRRQSE